MGPLVAIPLAVGAVVAGYLFFRRNAVPGQVKGQLPGVVNSLTKGRTYAVMATIAAQDNRSGHKAIGTLDVPTASAVIKSTYEQLGFKVLSSPTLRNTGEVSDFLHKNPSIWLFNAQWTQDAPKPVEPPWLLSQTFVTLPVQ